MGVVGEEEGDVELIYHLGQLGVLLEEGVQEGTGRPVCLERHLGECYLMLDLLQTLIPMVDELHFYFEGGHLQLRIRI